jgi:hypothetical protein
MYNPMLRISVLTRPRNTLECNEITSMRSTGNPPYSILPYSSVRTGVRRSWVD